LSFFPFRARTLTTDMIVHLLSTIKDIYLPYNTLQHTATHCNTLQHTTTHCNTLQYTAWHVPNVLSVAEDKHLTVTHCITPQHFASHILLVRKSWRYVSRCNTPTATHIALVLTVAVDIHFAATHCNTLQHTTTRCNTYCPCFDSMGWLRSVGSIKLYASCAEYCLFCRALLQKRPII